jgi:hypothetical protein
MQQWWMAPLSALLAAVYFDPDHLGVQQKLKESLGKSGLQGFQESLEEKGFLPPQAAGDDDKDSKVGIAHDDEWKPCECNETEVINPCECKPCEIERIEPCECKPCEKVEEPSPLSLSAIALGESVGELPSHIAIFAMESFLSWMQPADEPTKLPEDQMHLWAGALANASQTSLDMLPPEMAALAHDSYVMALEMIPPEAKSMAARPMVWFLKEFQTRFPKYQLDSDRPFSTMCFLAFLCVCSCVFSYWHILGVWKLLSFLVRGVFCCPCRSCCRKRSTGKTMDIQFPDGSQDSVRQNDDQAKLTHGSTVEKVER